MAAETTVSRIALPPDFSQRPGAALALLVVVEVGIGERAELLADCELRGIIGSSSSSMFSSSKIRPCRSSHGNGAPHESQKRGGV
jgi:hypothetical protein